MVPVLSVPGEEAVTSHIVGPSGQVSLSGKGVEEGETEGSLTVLSYSFPEASGWA